MTEFNIEKEVKDGLDIIKLFKTIILYSLSLFLGFYWKDLITEAINTYLPEGTNLISKFCIAVILTVIILLFCFTFLTERKKFGKAKI